MRDLRPAEERVAVPAQGENRAPPPAPIRPLRGNSLRIGTGNLFRPNRELNRAIREVSALIRESCICISAWLRGGGFSGVGPPHANAGLSRAGVSGARRRRTPVASKMALAMAPA